MSILLISGGEVFTPGSSDISDVLVVNGHIESIHHHAMSKDLKKLFPEVRVIDASGHMVVPGFIDQHVHMNGGGGEGGPQNRTPLTSIGEYVEGGVTSAIGLMGTDHIGRSLESLLMTARSLEHKGINTWILTGSYSYPSPTICGSIQKDIVLIDKVIGVKLALSDHRSMHISAHELRRLVSEARLGGIMTGKAGVIIVHMGNESPGLEPILECVRDTDIPLKQFAPTHLGRNGSLLEQAIEYGKQGGYVDLTYRGDSTLDMLKEVTDRGVPVERITVSSDGHGSKPVFNDQGDLVSIGMHSLSGVFNVFRGLVERSVFPMEDVIRITSANVAEHFCLQGRGIIKEGNFADLLVIDKESMDLSFVVCNGKILMEEGKLIVSDF